MHFQTDNYLGQPATAVCRTGAVSFRRQQSLHTVDNNWLMPSTTSPAGFGISDIASELTDSEGKLEWRFT